jgi:hypothetical protein
MIFFATDHTKIFFTANILVIFWSCFVNSKDSGSVVLFVDLKEMGNRLSSLENIPIHSVGSSYLGE